MGHRLSKIYTRTGDAGTTGLGDGSRVDDLFDLGGEFSTPGRRQLTQAYVDRLEHSLDAFNADLPRLKEFILPGGGPAAATCHLARCHLARTVCRRAERRAITLAREADVNPVAIAYLNRLSDLLFVIARVLARHERGSEVLWEPGRNRGE